MVFGKLGNRKLYRYYDIYSDPSRNLREVQTIHEVPPRPKTQKQGCVKTSLLISLTSALIHVEIIKPGGRVASIKVLIYWFIITFLKHKPHGVIRKAYYAQYILVDAVRISIKFAVIN